jgi:hypothetical protein
MDAELGFVVTWQCGMKDEGSSNEDGGLAFGARRRADVHAHPDLGRPSAG